MSLLDKAKSISQYRKTGPHNQCTPESIELALAFLHGEVTAKGVGVALNAASTNITATVVSILRQALRNGEIKIKKV